MERWCWTADTGKQQVRKDTNDVFVGRRNGAKDFRGFQKVTYHFFGGPWSFWIAKHGQ